MAGSSPAMTLWKLRGSLTLTPYAIALEAEADAAGGQMVGRATEADRPRGGGSMRGIHGGAEHLVHGADIEVAILAEQIRAAVAEGEASAGLGLCCKGPGRGVGVGVEVVDAGFQRIGLGGRGAVDGDV